MVRKDFYMPYTGEVFGVSRQINQYSYYDRKGLDRKLTLLLRRDTHIAIKGPSKCGKSWLRQKCLTDAIIVQCRPGMTVEDIYRQALSFIDIQFDVNCSSVTSFSTEFTGHGKIGIPLVANTTAEASGSIERSQGFGVSLDFATSIQNLKFIADSITSSGKRLVIEDFHYLDLSTRERLAFDLKTFWDYSCNIIIIGVWTQTNLLTSMNPDLTGRMEEISVSWEKEDLHQVIHKGSSFLNIEIDSTIENDMINDSFGNIGILQSLLLRLVEDESGIDKTQSVKMYIANPTLYTNAARTYATQLDGLYQQFAKTLSAGIRQRKKSTGIYALAMEAIVKGTDKQLMDGFSRNDIFTIANAKEPRVQKGNLKTVLRKLVELQKPGKVSRNLVITYDESIDAVFAVDLQLLFYRKHHTMKWPWEEMAKEARQLSLFEADGEP